MNSSNLNNKIMKNASAKFLAITFAFIVYATILFLIMLTLPLHAQTNVPAENGTNSPVAVTDSAPASNAVAAAETKVQKKFSESSSVRTDNTGLPHIHFQATEEKNPAVDIMAIVAVFGMPVAIVAIFFYFKHHRNKMVHETMRAMIEKGVPITPELIAQLRNKPSGFSNQSGQQVGRSRQRHLLPGLVLTGIGTALLISHPGYPSSGGLIVLFIGVAFLIVWFVERTGKNNNQPPKQ